LVYSENVMIVKVLSWKRWMREGEFYAPEGSFPSRRRAA